MTALDVIALCYAYAIPVLLLGGLMTWIAERKVK